MRRPLLQAGDTIHLSGNIAVVVAGVPSTNRPSDTALRPQLRFCLDPSLAYSPTEPQYSPSRIPPTGSPRSTTCSTGTWTALSLLLFYAGPQKLVGGCVALSARNVAVRPDHKPQCPVTIRAMA